ncbi:MAG: hypothetical protein JXX29_01050 [Deltaproteobacteria bacterium]|nr:hypothetical protein [Deltaproteobacteria bacterium]MBN2670225.1 hypothetical protein [Deltaproteobacteria bacterium]
MNSSFLICIIGVLVVLLATACTEDNNGSSNSGGALDCPGVDGNYYYVLMPKGDCADQGVTLVDDGFPVQDHGVLMMSSSGCATSAEYDGCSLSSEMHCDNGISMTFSVTFTVGTPNQFTGTQIQSYDGVADCTYDVFGSTDREAVLSHAGLSDDIDVSNFSTPGTPTPENLSAASSECSAYVAAEEAVCPGENDALALVEICTEDWKSFDARGCGDGWLAYINCRTENAAAMDCETGEIPACDVYLNAYFQCTSAFAASTDCSVAGDPETLCTEGGTYSYGCFGDSAPFADCSAVETESAAAMYCCF